MSNLQWCKYHVTPRMTVVTRRSASNRRNRTGTDGLPEALPELGARAERHGARRAHCRWPGDRPRPLYAVRRLRPPGRGLPRPGLRAIVPVLDALEGAGRNEGLLRKGRGMKLYKGHAVMHRIGHERVHVVRSYLVVAKNWREARERISEQEPAAELVTIPGEIAHPLMVEVRTIDERECVDLRTACVWNQDRLSDARGAA